MITPELLKSWSPCADGYKRFIQLFPNGSDLDAAIDGLVADGHDEWGYWLFDQCRIHGLYCDVISRGYRNSGDRNSGDRNSGDWNSGYRNSGDRNSGDWNSGDRNSGDWNSGDWNSGGWNSGDRNSGDRNSGDRNSGDRNSGDWNSGGWNSGDRNSGGWNSGDWNSGDRNSGYRNSGDGNSGGWNSGDRNSGDRNSGDWNSGGWNSGFFNTTIPQTVRVFGVDIPRGEWDACYKPKFLCFDLTQWIVSDSMTDSEKAALPSHEIAGGFLKAMGYKEAFRRSWDQADPNDRMKITAIPGFNAEMFYEISGIDLRGEVDL